MTSSDKDPSGAANDDDWSTISDRMSRKRVQNRLAQRNYRKNLKKRIEELERQAAARSGPDASNASLAMPVLDPTASSIAFPSIPNFFLHPSQVNYDMTYGPAAFQLSKFVPQSYHQVSHSQGPEMVAQSQVPKNLAYDIKSGNAPNLSISPFTDSAFSTLGTDSSNGSGINQASLTGDILSNDSEKNEVSAGSAAVSVVASTATPDAERSTLVATASDIDWHTSSISDNNDFPGTPQINPLPLETFVPTPPWSATSDQYAGSEEKSRTRKDQCCSPASQSQIVLEHHVSSEETVLESRGGSNRVLPGSVGLTEQLEHVLENIHLSGFDGLESVVSKYYTSDFSSSPRLASTRRHSRNRRLPGVLSDLRESMPTWTEWESQGYKDEILRSAESILVAERRNLSSTPQFQDFLIKSRKDHDPRSSPSLAEMSSILENESPNLWALITSLTTDGFAIRQADLHLTLAAMSILYFSGKTSKEELRVWVDRCLRD